MAFPRPKIDYDGRALVDAHGPHVPVRVIVHDTESHDVRGIADLEGVAQFWHRQDEGYGSHIGIDKSGNTGRYVRDTQVAWHTGGRNTGSLGIELIGFASFTRSIWGGRRKQRNKLAHWMAYYAHQYHVPLVWDVERGFSTHRMQSKAYPALTQHTDPGRFFPKRRVMRLARRYYRSA